MTRDGVNKTTRVIFACEQHGAGASIFAALSKLPDVEVEEVVGDLREIFQKAVSKSADLTVLFFPELTNEHERCVRRISLATFSHIMLLADSDVSSEITSNADRINVRGVSNSKNSIDSIVALAASLCAVKHRSFAPKSSDTSESASKQREAASVLAQGALAKKIVAVGASTGGTEALASLFRGLKPTMPGIVVVQHMPPVFTEMFAQRLDRELPFDVFEARDNMQIKLNSIHIAPGDRHLIIKKIGSNFFTFLGDTQRVGGHCPAVNVLFQSVAKAAGSDATGVILTGMGSDGAEGMLEMRNRGAFTVGQDEKSCIVYGMPRTAFEIGAVVKQAPLGDIAGILMKHFGTVK